MDNKINKVSKNWCRTGAVAVILLIIIIEIMEAVVGLPICTSCILEIYNAKKKKQNDGTRIYLMACVQNCCIIFFVFFNNWRIIVILMFYKFGTLFGPEPVTNQNLFTSSFFCPFSHFFGDVQMNTMPRTCTNSGYLFSTRGGRGGDAD